MYADTPVLDDAGKVLLVDWDVHRAQNIRESLAELPIIVVHTEDMQTIPVPDFDVILLPAVWPNKSSGNSSGIQSAVQLLDHSKGMRANLLRIVFGCMNDNVTLTECCQFLLAGAQQLVESDDPDALRTILQTWLDTRRPTDGKAEAHHTAMPGIVFASEEMGKVLQQVKKAALLKNITVLLSGPTGTGKQKLAEVIHALDPWRKHTPLMTLNCSTISGALAESELFGHRRGAYTGATADRLGLFRMASGGTLFLDEIGELELGIQPKLLRVLEERKVKSLGQDAEVPIDVRVIAATNRDLKSMAKGGTFRMDLYQRLSMLEIHVPPLSTRPDDLYPLIMHFLAKHGDIGTGEVKHVHRNVIDVLSKYEFEGNVRELENLVRHLLFHKRTGDTILIEDLPIHLIEKIAKPLQCYGQETHAEYLSWQVVQLGRSLEEVLSECESTVVASILRLSRGSRSAAAEMLHISERTLYNKLHSNTILKSGFPPRKQPVSSKRAKSVPPLAV